MASEFEEYLRDSFERARTLDEQYSEALLNNLEIIRPNLYCQLDGKFYYDFHNYKPQAWNTFLAFVNYNWNA